VRKSVVSILVTTAALAGLIPAGPALAGGTTTGADIQVSGSSNLGSPVQGQPYVYTYQVKNSGPQDALAATFTDDLTAGTLAYAAVDGMPSFCTTGSDGGTGTAVSCRLWLAKGGQQTVTLSVTAPTTVGTFSNTGRAGESDLADPNPANNAATVNAKVGSAACPLPAGQSTVTGLILNRFNDSFGLPSRLAFIGNDGVQYTVFVNVDDPTAPATTVINLLCKVVPPTLYIQPATTDNVTGTLDMEVLPGATVATPVIHASVVQTPFWTDKVA